MSKLLSHGLAYAAQTCTAASARTSKATDLSRVAWHCVSHSLNFRSWCLSPAGSNKTTFNCQTTGLALTGSTVQPSKPTVLCMRGLLSCRHHALGVRIPTHCMGMTWCAWSLTT